MSSQTEFHDLEAQLRQQKPPTEPISPAFKGHLRGLLMEQQPMKKQKNVSWGQLSTAVGSLVLLIGIPIFFWLILGGNSQPGGGITAARETPTAVTLEAITAVTATPIPTNAPLDHIYLLEAFPTQGTFLQPTDQIQLTVGYTLTSKPEAQLIVKLLMPTEEEAMIGVGTYQTTVGAGLGTATFNLMIDDLGIIATGTPLSLNLFLQPLDGTERLLATTFTEGWYYEAETAVPQSQAMHLKVTEFQAENDDTFLLQGMLTTNFDSNTPTDVTITLQDRTGETLTSQIVTMTPSTATEQVELSLSLQQIPLAPTPFQLLTTATVENSQHQTSQPILIMPPNNDPATDGDIWVIAANPVYTEESVALHLLVGYSLNPVYTHGEIGFSGRYRSPSGGGGGGGGGGGQSVAPGTGTFMMPEFAISDTSGLADGQDWTSFLTIELQLYGLTEEGTRLLVDTYSDGPLPLTSEATTPAS